MECGAFDGERSSNTMWLERERGWTGLLVEMDPYFYTQLIGKSRRSWSINACLSPQPYVTQVRGRPAIAIGPLLLRVADRVRDRDRRSEPNLLRLGLSLDLAEERITLAMAAMANPNPQVGLLQSLNGSVVIMSQSSTLNIVPVVEF